MTVPVVNPDAPLLAEVRLALPLTSVSTQLAAVRRIALVAFGAGLVAALALAWGTSVILNRRVRGSRSLLSPFPVRQLHLNRALPRNPHVALEMIFHLGEIMMAIDALLGELLDSLSRGGRDFRISCARFQGNSPLDASLNAVEIIRELAPREGWFGRQSFRSQYRRQQRLG